LHLLLKKIIPFPANQPPFFFQIGQTTLAPRSLIH